MMQKKIWLIQNNISIYRVKLFETISKSQNIDFKLILLAEGSSAYPWQFDLDAVGFKAERVKGLTLQRGQTFRVTLNLALLVKMLREKPDLMIASGYSFATILIMLYKLLTATPYVIWSESTKETEKKFSKLRHILRKVMVSYADSYVVAGKLSREYVESFLPPEHGKIFFISYNCADKEYFEGQSEKLKHDEEFTKTFRARYPQKNILFVGQLIDRKGVRQLLNVYNLLVQSYSEPIGLIILGDGPLRSYAEQFKKENGLDYLYLEGLVDYQDIPRYYSFADLSILLSLSDPNPLVVFESLYCGVPIICSNRAGNYYDFIFERENGCVVDPVDADQIVECIKYFLTEVDTEKVRQFSKKSVENSNYTAAAKGFIDAAAQVLDNTARRRDMEKESPRVIVVGPLPPPIHGVTISTQRILSSDLNAQFDVTHLDTSDHRAVDNIGAFDIQNFTLAFRSYLHLVKACFRSRPDIVYVPISQTFLGFFRDAFYLIVPKMFGAKVVIHLRGGHFDTFYEGCGLFTRKAIDLVLNSVDRVIVLGEVLRPIFHRWFADSQIDVAPNGTDLIFEGVEKKLAMRERARRFTFMSSLMRTKGLVEYVKAALMVLEKFPDCTFHVAGEWWGQEPDLQPEVESLLSNSEYKARFIFHGLTTGKEKNMLLLNTDVFVLPTYYPFEGHPNAIVEAMAAGCPVISTDHAAISETVLDGVCGRIVAKRNSEALLKIMLEFIEDEVIFHSMAKASHQRYKKNYTAEISTDKIISSLLKAINLAG